MALDGAVFVGEALDVTLSDAAGQMQILPGHAEAYVVVAVGDIAVRRPDGTVKAFPAQDGILHVLDDKVTIAL